MSLEYTWSFPQLDVVFDENGMKDVVTNIHWVLTAVDEDYSVYCYGAVRVGAPDPQSFIPYQQLTEAEVQAWTEQVLGQETVDTYKASLAAQINEQKNPKSGQLPPPWSA